MTDSPHTVQSIAIIGGTGKEGKGLAYRWAKAGYKMIIGSRSSEKAVAAADEINHILLTNAAVVGCENTEAARRADIVVLTVPYAAHVATLETIRSELVGKILIDVTVPLVPPKVARVQMPPAGSAAQEAQAVVGPEVQVVSAFQNISYEHLLHDESVECDVLVCGGNKAARSTVLSLVCAAGLTGWDAGPIENSVVVEGLTSVLIGINKQFGVLSAGIRITGVSQAVQNKRD
jgi:NADPH-dependent F420 reductase